MTDMTEGDKYYTPEIEEFHIGFEYEISSKSFYPEETTWSRFSFSTFENFDYIKLFIQQGHIRVRHLCHDDIVELGWEKDLSDSRSTCFIKRVENETHYLWFFDNGTILIFKNNKYGHRENLFSGTLKSKSDLKRLMKQLGI